MWKSLLLATLPLVPLTAQDAQDAPDKPAAEDPHRQFDFWVGEWSVQNRHMRPDGSWANGSVTRARITPVCGGKAVLEEWAGPFRGSFMNGFSLRSYNPGEQRWNLLLFWTTSGDGSFGQLHGTFRHGRGEFFVPPNEGQERTRYSFSDGLAKSVRWDSAITKDGGITWKTDWIMEFSRTRAAQETTQQRLFDVHWTEGQVSKREQARALDWMLGDWKGTQQDAKGEERESRLRCKLLNKDCLVLSLLESRASGSDDWDERLAVRGWDQGKGRWESWSLSEADSVMRRSIGSQAGERLVFETSDPETGFRVQEVLQQTGEEQMTIEILARMEAEGEPVLMQRIVLERVQ